jgi:hypothetical protein
VTFGAPMVLHARAPDALFARLRALEAAAEATGGGAELQFHNFVNNADVVRAASWRPSVPPRRHD